MQQPEIEYPPPKKKKKQKQKQDLNVWFDISLKWLHLNDLFSCFLSCPTPTTKILYEVIQNRLKVRRVMATES